MNVLGIPPPLVSVGKLLRGARVSQDLEIADIAAELCLDQRYLRAIEVDDLPSLPGAFFYKSFVRQYGARLGVDPQTLRSAVETFMLPAVPMEVTAQAPAARAAPVHAVPIDPAPPCEINPILEKTNHPPFSTVSLKWSAVALVMALVGCSGLYQ